LKVINHLPDFFGPLKGRLGRIEMVGWDWFAENYFIFLSLGFVKFVGQVQHWQVEFYSKGLAEGIDSVKVIGIASDEVDRDDPPLG
jgi:hypothetical protein